MMSIVLRLFLSSCLLLVLTQASPSRVKPMNVKGLLPHLVGVSAHRTNITRGNGGPAHSRIDTVLGKLTSLRADIIAQHDLAETKSKESLTALHFEIDKVVDTIEAVSSDLQDVKQVHGLSEERLADINMQLFGTTPASKIPASESADLSGLSIDFDLDGPDGLPEAGPGSVLQVVRMVWEQIIALRHGCQVDGVAHTRRASTRSDIEAINHILSLIHDAKSRDVVPGCPLCNSTACRQLQDECVLTGSNASLPVEVKPDMATCWYLLDSYCNSPYGASDPGCACNASSRCWEADQTIGRCPIMSSTADADGSSMLHCVDLPPLECDAYYQHADIQWGAPALSAADEVLIATLRDLRREIVTTPQQSSTETESRLSHCATDEAALKRHFLRAEEIAQSLWRHRADVASDLQVTAALIDSKSRLLHETEGIRTALLKRVAMEMQVQTERAKEVKEQLQALVTARDLLSGEFGAGLKQATEINKANGLGRGVAASCQEHLMSDPTLSSGIYWVTLGQPEAVRVYCDMTTDGGGWTLIWKNVGGAIDTSAKLQHANNQDLLLNISRVDVVTPHAVDRKAQINHPAYRYYSSRPNQEWLKTMALMQGPTRGVVTQRVRVQFNHAMMDEVFNLAEGCSHLTDYIDVYSSRRGESSLTAKTTNYLMGKTRTAINRRGQSYGLANIGTFEDMCAEDPKMFLAPEDMCSAVGGKPKSSPTTTEPLVCDMQMLLRLENAKSATANLTVVGGWEMVRHLFSYMHQSPSARHASRCMFKCWDDDDTDSVFNEVFVWAARGRCPVDEFERPCSGHGTCKESLCTCEPGWSGEVCQEKHQCPPPPSAPVKGNRISCSGSGTDFGDVCKYACESGHRFVGTDAEELKSECGADGWTPLTATCEPVDCGVFVPTRIGGDGTASIYCTGTKFEDQCTVTCEYGFSLNSPASGVSCSATGEWIWATSPATSSSATTSRPVSQYPGTCDLITCPSLPSVQDAILECDTVPALGGLYGAGTTCIFTCAPNFRMSGSGTRKCTFNGTFDGASPSCAAIRCPAPVPPPNVTVKCGTPFPPEEVMQTGYAIGDVCEYSCQTGFYLTGSHTTNCSATSPTEGAFTNGPDGVPSCLDQDPCRDTICTAGVPSCPTGQYVVHKSRWNGCCFNREVDCAAFDRFVTFDLGIPEADDDGIVTENKLRRVIAEVANVRPYDVNVLRSVIVSTNQSWTVRTMTVAPSSNSSMESHVPTLVQSLENALVSDTSGFQSRLQAAGISVSGILVINQPVIAPRIPTDIARAINFVDQDGRAGWIKGEVVVHAAIEPSISTIGYEVFFGDGASAGPLNRVGDALGTAYVNKDGTPLCRFDLRSTEVPRGAKDLLAFAINDFAIAVRGHTYPISLVPRAAPAPAGTITFIDQDTRRGWVMGTLNITLVNPEASITDVVVYFGDGRTGAEGKTGPAVGEAVVMPSMSMQTILVDIPVSVSLPSNSTHFMVFARNVDIESTTAMVSPFTNAFMRQARALL